LASKVRRAATSEGNERPGKTLERHPAVGLSGRQGAVDSGQREARELVSDRAPRVVAERGRSRAPGAKMHTYFLSHIINLVINYHH